MVRRAFGAGSGAKRSWRDAAAIVAAASSATTRVIALRVCARTCRPRRERMPLATASGIGDPAFGVTCAVDAPAVVIGTAVADVFAIGFAAIEADPPGVVRPRRSVSVWRHAFAPGEARTGPHGPSPHRRCAPTARSAGCLVRPPRSVSGRSSRGDGPELRRMWSFPYGG
jgi:hypothetical protein